MTLAPGTHVGQYEIVERIGGGGMGTVYKARQASLNRYVALKTLHEESRANQEFRLRFVAEGLAIGKLRHPNIVAAFDFAEHDGMPYLVSEFVDGGTLQEQLGPQLPVDYVARTLTPIASALDYAHSRGVVHRDVKPTNILLARDGTPVLTDFGLASMMGGLGLTTGGPLGTPQYISPENVTGEEAGPAADQYALAMVAYEMLTGRHPFLGDGPVAMMFAHVNKPIPAPHELGVAMPQTSEAALLRALAKKPAERFPSVIAFTRALGDAASVATPTMTQVAEAAPAPTTVAPAQFAPKGAARLGVVRAGAGLAVALALAGSVVFIAPRMGFVAADATQGPTTEPSATPGPTLGPAPTLAPSTAPSIVPSPTALPTPERTAQAVFVPTPGPTRPTAPPTAPTPAPPSPSAAPQEHGTLVSTTPTTALAAGQSGTCTVVYENSGASPWLGGTPYEADLKFAASTPTRVRAWTTTGANGVLATQNQNIVEVGKEASFTFGYTVAPDTTTGTYVLTVQPVLGGGVIGPDARCQVSATATGPVPSERPGPEPSDPPPDPNAL